MPRCLLVLLLLLCPGLALAEEEVNVDEVYWQDQDWQQYGEAKQVGSQLTLWHKSNQGYRLGLALLLPDWQQVSQLLPLSHALNEQGFDTLTMLPSPRQQDLDPGSETAQQAVQAFRQQWAEQVKDLLKNAGDNSGHRLWVAQGSSAAWLASLLAAQQLPAPEALILLDAAYPAKDANAVMARELVQLPLPVLDLYRDTPHPWRQQAADERKLQARRSNKLDWRQQTYQTPSQWDNQVKGWLHRIGWQ